MMVPIEGESNTPLRDNIIVVLKLSKYIWICDYVRSLCWDILQSRISGSEQLPYIGIYLMCQSIKANSSVVLHDVPSLP